MVDLAEVERAVCSHPAVETCMVRKEGRELLASVVCLNGETEMSDIQKYLGNLMATYKIPKMTKVRK
jgi:acyl-CoA synthetase (AMP-forming)/AMP-acid ligase II